MQSSRYKSQSFMRAFFNPLLPAEVTELEHGRFRVQQQVLRFDVPVADAKRVYVRQAPE